MAGRETGKTIRSRTRHNNTTDRGISSGGLIEETHTISVDWSGLLANVLCLECLCA